MRICTPVIRPHATPRAVEDGCAALMLKRAGPVGHGDLDRRRESSRRDPRSVEHTSQKSFEKHHFAAQLTLPCR